MCKTPNQPPHIAVFFKATVSCPNDPDNTFTKVGNDETFWWYCEQCGHEHEACDAVISEVYYNDAEYNDHSPTDLRRLHWSQLLALYAVKEERCIRLTQAEIDLLGEKTTADPLYLEKVGDLMFLDKSPYHYLIETCMGCNLSTLDVLGINDVKGLIAWGRLTPNQCNALSENSVYKYGSAFQRMLEGLLNPFDLVKRYEVEITSDELLRLTLDRGNQFSVRLIWCTDPALFTVVYVEPSDNNVRVVKVDPANLSSQTTKAIVTVGEYLRALLSVE